MNEVPSIVTMLKEKFGDPAILAEQITIDGITTLWIKPEDIKKI